MQQGDTLDSISYSLNLYSGDVKNTNPTSPTPLTPGSSVKLPYWCERACVCVQARVHAAAGCWCCMRKKWDSAYRLMDAKRDVRRAVAARGMQTRATRRSPAF